MSTSYIPTSARVIIIIQLCIAFGLITWRLIAPLGLEHVQKKSEKNLVSSAVQSPLFTEIPEGTQQSILTFYKKLDNTPSLSFIGKVKQSLSSLFTETNFFLQIWCYITLIAGFLILFRIQGGISIQFLSFFLSLFFLFSGGASRPEDPLFPSENEVITQYLGHPLSRGWQTQRKELSYAWNRYLITLWAKETPSKNQKVFNIQIEKGLFFFNLERVKYLMIHSNY